MASLARVLAPFDEVRLAVLFGSAAAGRLAAESDLDVAVAGEAPLSADRRLAISRAVSEATGREIDLLDLTAATGPILHQALTTGRVVLCRDQVLHAGLMRRMLFDEADFGPLRRRLLAERRARFLRKHG